jgi:hypothetical protein
MGAIFLGPIGIVEPIADGTDGVADLSLLWRLGQRFKYFHM